MKPTEPNDATALRELENEFTLVRELGRGATATVYLARRYGAGQLVAIKLVRPHVADAQALERLDREARTVARLSHPNIVRHYEFRQLGGGAVAIVMQFVAGETLATRLARTPQRPVAEVEHVLRDVANALEYAHASAVIHRDIKPGNILLEAETKSALLSDFGIAKFLDGDAKLTLDGVTIGTPAYMSPEQIDGRSLDGRSDLYSLGVVGWEMLTGSKPWAGESLYSVIYKQKFEALPPLEELRPDVPPRVALAIAGVLHKKRSLRLPSATEFLRQLSQDQPTLSARSRPWVAAASLQQELEAASAAPTLQFPIPSAPWPTSADAPSLVPPAPAPEAAPAPAPAAAPAPAPAAAAAPAPASSTAPALASSTAPTPATVPAPAAAPAAAASPPLSPLPAPREVAPAPAPAIRPAAAVSPPVEQSSAVGPSRARAEVATVGGEPVRRRAVFASLSAPDEAPRRWRPNVVGAAVLAATLVVAMVGSLAVTRRGAAGPGETTPPAVGPASRQTSTASACASRHESAQSSRASNASRHVSAVRSSAHAVCAAVTSVPHAVETHDCAAFFAVSRQVSASVLQLAWQGKIRSPRIPR